LAATDAKASVAVWIYFGPFIIEDGFCDLIFSLRNSAARKK